VSGINRSDSGEGEALRFLPSLLASEIILNTSKSNRSSLGKARAGDTSSRRRHTRVDDELIVILRKQMLCLKSFRLPLSTRFHSKLQVPWAFTCALRLVLINYTCTEVTFYFQFVLLCHVKSKKTYQKDLKNSHNFCLVPAETRKHIRSPSSFCTINVFGRSLIDIVSYSITANRVSLMFDS
jgi:hypothetical protein